MNDLRLITLVATAHFVSHFFQLALPPLFPVLRDEFGVGYVALGVVISAFYGASAVSQALSGFFVDRFGARRIVLAGTAALAGGIALAGLAGSVPRLVAVALLAGLGSSVFHPADRTVRHDLVAAGGILVAALLVLVVARAMALTGCALGVAQPARDLLVRAVTPPGASGRVFGFAYSGMDVGSAVTPVVFGWLLDHGHPRTLFVVVAALMLVTIGTVVEVRRGARAAPVARNANRRFWRPSG